jgi:uncharacterized protein (TIGR03435 family)
MLRNLLADRFQLTAHAETREFPVFALVRARRDGTLGRGLQRRTAACTPGLVGPARLTPRSSDRRTCGGNAGPGFLVANGATMENITSGLAELVPGINRIVVDRTGLTGMFDIDLRWTPDSPVTFGGQVVPPFDGNAPSLFTAIREQLGLKLESTRAPVDVLVIDRVERPSAN